MRAEVIQLHYDVLVAEHGGKWKTVELVMRNYWWPEVTRDVGRYVKKCDLCQGIMRLLVEFSCTFPHLIA